MVDSTRSWSEVPKATDMLEPALVSSRQVSFTAAKTARAGKLVLLSNLVGSVRKE